MKTMKALVLEHYGAPFGWVEIPRPRATEGQVLVRIRASGVNPLDTKIRAGQAAHARHPLPAILGMDLAGVVEEAGPEVTGFQPGDEVFGMTGGVGGVPGTLAEFAAVDSRLLAPKPPNLSMREAAALPLIFITAWEGLIDRVDLDSRQNVLVLGGGGGVGQMVIQIARSIGSDVYGVDGAAKADSIRNMGAAAIDVATEAPDAYVAKYTGGKGFDVVYDTVGGASLDTAFQVVTRFGHVVSSLGWGSHSLAPLSFKSATYSGVFTLTPLLTGEGREHHGGILREATRLATAGKLWPRLDSRTFTPANVVEAYELIEQRKARGKLVVEIG
jgi:NADPH2:quinone reductase